MFSLVDGIVCSNLGSSSMTAFQDERDESAQCDPVGEKESGTQTLRTAINNDVACKIGYRKNQEVQTDQIHELLEKMRQEWLKKTDMEAEEAKIAQFLKGILHDMEEQLELNAQSHAFEFHTVNWEEEICDISCAFTFDLPSRISQSDKMKKEISDPSFKSIHDSSKTKSNSHLLSVTDLSWNSKGNLIAAAYGRTDQVGWCYESGYICIWNIADLQNDSQLPPINQQDHDFHHDKNRFETFPQYTIEVDESYVMCIEFHPKLSNVIVAGTYDGGIKVWKLLPEMDSLIAATKVDKYSHKDPVTSVTWLKNPRMDSSYLIASISTDGSLLIWSMKNHLQQPYAAYSFSYLTKDVPLGASTFSFINIHAGSSLQKKIVPSPDNYFIIGTELGHVYKAILSSARLIDTNKKLEHSNLVVRKNQIDFSYESQVGYIHRVDCSPFHKNLFLTTSTDSMIRLFNVFQTKDIMTLKPCDGFIYDAKWSPFRPLVLAAGSSNGHIYLYDLGLENSVKPREDINAGNGRPITTIEFNPVMREYLASGDASGTLKIWRLSDKLTISQQKEAQKLSEIVDGMSQFL